MADRKETISQQPAASALSGSEVAPFVQGGQTKKATVDQVLTPAVTGTQVARHLRDRTDDFRSAKNWGATGDGTTLDTVAIQAAIDFMYALGGGTVHLPNGAYKIGPSALAETYDNFGTPVAASACGLVLRRGVSLVGEGSGSTRLFSTDASIIMLALVAPLEQSVVGIEIQGGASVPTSGAGHGIFTLSTSGGALEGCKDVLLDDLIIKNVAGYGIGLQSGIVTNTRISNIHIENIGADGCDLKCRSTADTTSEGNGNSADNIVVRNHGQRVTGSCGIDIRGIWTITNVQVLDFGGNASLDYVGVRFRTKQPALDPNRIGSRSTLNGFYVRPTVGAAALSVYGVQSGSDDAHISNGTTQDCTAGVQITGNVNGSALRNIVHNVTAISSRQYGFETSVNADNTTFSECVSISAVTAGFRNASLSTTYVGCRSVTDTATTSVSGGALPTQCVVGCNFGADLISLDFVTAGRVGVSAKGGSTNIDLALIPKGTGLVRFEYATTAATTPASFTADRILTFKDSTGTTYRIPCRAAAW